MNRANYEKWWSENLFKNKKFYKHLNEEIKMPSLEEFSESWMGSVNDIDRIQVRKYFKGYRSILDVGCGGSPEYYGIKKYKNLVYTGLDITPELVEFNTNKGINCVLGSANQIPFQDSSFEIVHSRHVLEHMSDFKKPLLEMVRVSKKIVLISFFIELLDSEISEITLDNKDTEFEIYHNRYSKKELSDFLLKNNKVKKLKFKKLSGQSKDLLLIKIKN